MSCTHRYRVTEQDGKGQIQCSRCGDIRQDGLSLTSDQAAIAERVTWERKRRQSPLWLPPMIGLMLWAGAVCGHDGPLDRYAPRPLESYYQPRTVTIDVQRRTQPVNPWAQPDERLTCTQGRYLRQVTCR